jgi:choline dehydrogenase
VLLVEAGGRERWQLRSWQLRMPVAFQRATYGLRWDWRLKSEPEPHLGGRELALLAGRVIGGSSSINGMLYMRGHPRDYDGWECPGWSHADLLPYFIRAESSWHGAGPLHGGDGPIEVQRARPTDLDDDFRAAAAGRGHRVAADLNIADFEGVGPAELSIQRNGRRSSAALTYLRPAIARGNLTVLPNATVRRVLVEGNAATGIELAGRRVMAAREVILCAGGYQSPKLLMLSGIGPAGQLEPLGIKPVANLGGVGRRLVNHAMLLARFSTREPVAFLRGLRLDRAAVSALRWALSGGGPFATLPCAGRLYARTDPSLERPDVSLAGWAVAMNAAPWMPVVRPRAGNFIDATITLLRPFSEGSVALRSADPADPPRIRTGLLADARDVDTLLRAFRMLRELYATGPLARRIEGEVLPGPGVASDADIRAFLLRSASVAAHPVASCAMGTDENAVVDPELRVRGVRNLRVCDSSVIPAMISAGTYASTLAIAEKAADLVDGMRRAA